MYQLLKRRIRNTYRKPSLSKRLPSIIFALNTETILNLTVNVFNILKYVYIFWIKLEWFYKCKSTQVMLMTSKDKIITSQKFHIHLLPQFNSTNSYTIHSHNIQYTVVSDILQYVSTLWVFRGKSGGVVKWSLCTALLIPYKHSWVINI